MILVKPSNSSLCNSYSLKPDFRNHFTEAVDGASLFYERYGHGSPLLLCDGLLCDGHIWKYFIPAMGSSWECIHWNYPGHGRSSDPVNANELSVARLADNAKTILEHANSGPAIVVGHSMGTQVALELYNRHPECVRGLVLVCGSSGRLIENFHEGPLLNYLVPFFDLGTRFIPRHMSGIWKAIHFEKLLGLVKFSGEVNNRLIQSADLLQYFTRFNRVDFSVALRTLEAAGRHDASYQLGEIDVPSLVIGGELDTFTPAKRSVLLATRIPECESLLVKGGTHSLPIEQPELINLRIRRFLNENFLK